MLPPPSKSLPPKNEKPPTANNPPIYCITAGRYGNDLVLPLPPKKYRQPSTPPKTYRQLSKPRVHKNRRRRSWRGQACRLTLPYRCHEWRCEWYLLSACPCDSCLVAVLAFTCVKMSRHSIIIMFRGILPLIVRFT